MEPNMYSFLRGSGTSLALLLISLNLQAAPPNLVVYTYDSFTSEWGPGPQVKTAFEAKCACTLELVGLSDGVAMLNRLRLEGDNSRADILLGLDTNLTAEARASGLFEPHQLKLQASALPGPWRDDLFLPYDFGYFAFVYNRDKLASPPTSLRQLVDDANGATILIQDPRTSTPGLGLLLWMKAVFGDEADQAWARLSPRVVTVSKGWSEAYGLFLKGEADMVLSYTTSPAYHVIAEQDSRYAAAPFSEGHYQQIEVAGMLRSSQQKQLAGEFLEFMLSEDFQKIIPTTNWMYPAVASDSVLPAEFAELIDPSPALLLEEMQVAKERKAWVDEWLEVVSQ
ncbi:MAG: thiamine ABC transporter substrate binding subunit [Gammaproteobacteria bacterium]|nr:thiamine ABC transporter substrate binding subunit [Gammaproteobacteria bacterium]